MAILKEFRDFAVKGNAIDMAVGIIIGAAFGTIVDTLVKNIIMPPIGLLLGGVDFSNLFITLQDGVDKAGPYLSLEAAQAAGAVTIDYGLFINTLISFTIIAFSVFMMVKAINKAKESAKKEEEAAAAEEAATTKECPRCFSAVHLSASRCPHCTSDI